MENKILSGNVARLGDGPFYLQIRDIRTGSSDPDKIPFRQFLYLATAFKSFFALANPILLRTVSISHKVAGSSMVAGIL